MAKDVVDKIHDYFMAARKERKKIFLFLIHEIILGSKLGSPFVIQFGKRLKDIFTNFMNHCEEIQEFDKVSIANTF